MSKHLAILKGPQGERLPVICDNEAEARALEARAETRKAAPCPTCGRLKGENNNE
jgi:hypothetical protein